MNKLALVVLAAGASRRFGSLKQLADIDGTPLLQRVIDNCRPLADCDLYLALGAEYKQILKHIAAEQSQLIINENWQEGIAATIRTAVAELEEDYSAILFVAGDQPMIKTQQLADMIAQWQNNRALICAAHYRETLGIPAIFPKEYFLELKQLQGDKGAKALLLKQHSLQVVSIPEAALDIDYPEGIGAKE